MTLAKAARSMQGVGTGDKKLDVVLINPEYYTKYFIGYIFMLVLLRSRLMVQIMILSILRHKIL